MNGAFGGSIIDQVFVSFQTGNGSAIDNGIPVMQMLERGLRIRE